MALEWEASCQKEQTLIQSLEHSAIHVRSKIAGSYSKYIHNFEEVGSFSEGIILYPL